MRVLTPRQRALRPARRSRHSSRQRRAVTRAELSAAIRIALEGGELMGRVSSRLATLRQLEAFIDDPAELAAVVAGELLHDEMAMWTILLGDDHEGGEL